MYTPAEKGLDDMERYEWGKIIYPTKLSINRGVNNPTDLGICLGYKEKNGLIYVCKVPKHTVYTYSPDFWTSDSTGWKG